jgi:hypothetical protein
MSKLAVWSEYNVASGCAENAAQLVSAWDELGGEYVFLAGRTSNYNGTHKSLVLEGEAIQGNKNVFYVCETPGRSSSDEVDWGLTEELLDGCSYLLVHYQNFIVTLQQLNGIIQLGKKLGLKVCVIAHDHNLHQSIDWGSVDVIWIHNDKLKSIIPHGNIKTTCVPCEYDDSFSSDTIDLDGFAKVIGLGRNNYELIDKTCRKLNINLKILDGTNSCRLPEREGLVVEKKWLSREQMKLELKKSECILFYYEDIRGFVSSGGVSLALSGLRPVITNNNHWFDIFPNDVLIKADTPGRFAEHIGMRNYLYNSDKHLEFVIENSYRKACERLVKWLGQ